MNRIIKLHLFFAASFGMLQFSHAESFNNQLTLNPPILGISSNSTFTNSSISKTFPIYFDQSIFLLKNKNLTNMSTNKYLINENNDFNFNWKLLDGLSIRFNLFEDSINLADDFQNLNSIKNSKNFRTKSFNSNTAQSINRHLTGYQFSLASELGLGKSYRLGLNLGFGQIEGADLLGFNNSEVNTTQFGVGIRNSSFGASVNTDIYLEDMSPNLNQSSLGFEFDWHFSNNGKISFGSKSPIENSTKNSLSIDDVTGDVQYIKFQHNL